MNTKTGGPAFPRPIARVEYHNGESETSDAQVGMELRDYFAGQALIGVMVMRAVDRAQGFENVDSISQESIAEEAYELADAMLAARDKESDE